MTGRTLVCVRDAKVNFYNHSENGDLGVHLLAQDLPEEQLVVDGWGGERKGASWGIIKNKLYLITNQHVYWSELTKHDCQ